MEEILAYITLHKIETLLIGFGVSIVSFSSNANGKYTNAFGRYPITSQPKTKELT